MGKTNKNRIPPSNRKQSIPPRYMGTRPITTLFNRPKYVIEMEGDNIAKSTGIN